MEGLCIFRMKYLIYLLIAFSLLLLLSRTRDLADEVVALRAMNTIQSREIAMLQGRIALSDKNSQMVIDEVYRMFRHKNFVPLAIENTWLVYETE